MLRSACRRLPSRSLIRTPPVLIIHKPDLLICRQYVEKKPPLGNGKPPAVSDYIASQIPPSNTETPPDRMPRQTEGDVATEASIGRDRVIAGDALTEKAASGDGTPAKAVAIEHVGDQVKHPVADESFKEDSEEHSTEQVRRNSQTTATTASPESDPDDSIQANRRSILDLFGPGKTRKERKPRAAQQVSPPIVNPLTSHRLDTSSTDLSDWEKARGLGQYRSEHEDDPEKWVDMKRGEWESNVDNVRSRQKKHENDQAEFRKEIISTFINMPEPKPRGLRSINVSQLSISEPPPPSQWDYFYPSQPPPKSLSAAIRDDYERRNPRSVRQYEQRKAYNPFKRQKKPTLWPFMYNRDELVELCTNHLMRDGKKATAEKILQTMFLRVLEHYPRRHPVTVLAEALDRNAPILKNMNDRTTSLKLQITPVPLFEKQRIRIGWKSLIKAAGAKSKNRDGTRFPDRLANEVIKVMEGRGAGLPQRIAEHKKAMQNKLNIKLPNRRTN